MEARTTLPRYRGITQRPNKKWQAQLYINGKSRVGTRCTTAAVNRKITSTADIALPPRVVAKKGRGKRQRRRRGDKGRSYSEDVMNVAASPSPNRKRRSVSLDLTIPHPSSPPNSPPHNVTLSPISIPHLENIISKFQYYTPGGGLLSPACVSPERAFGGDHIQALIIAADRAENNNCNSS